MKYTLIFLILLLLTSFSIGSHINGSWECKEIGTINTETYIAKVSGNNQMTFLYMNYDIIDSLLVPSEKKVRDFYLEKDMNQGIKIKIIDGILFMKFQNWNNLKMKCNR